MERPLGHVVSAYPEKLIVEISTSTTADSKPAEFRGLSLNFFYIMGKFEGEIHG